MKLTQLWWPLIPRLKQRFHKLWTIRLALFWGAVCGLYGSFAALQDILPAHWFIGLSVFMNMAIVVARITKQPGVSEDE